MSGDVQPRKRKDKKKKKDDLGTEEPRGTAAALGEGDVFMHSYQDHGTGGHWCAKIIFFSLLAVLVTLIGLIILENRGLTELEANSVESRYSGVLEGWIEDAIDDHHDEHTLELKHHDDDEDHPDDQLDENEAEEESLEEEVDHNDDDHSNEDEHESDEIEDEDNTQNEDEDEDEEDEMQNDEDGIDDDDDEDEIQNDDDEEGESHNDEEEGQDEDSDDEGIEENLKNEDDEEETDELNNYEEISKSNEYDDEDDERDVEEQTHDYLSKEMTSHYNYPESYEDNGDDDESKENKYDDENESNEHNTEDEASEEDDQGDDEDDEQEIEKIEKEIIDGDDSEELPDNYAPARDASKESVKEDTSKEDDEPPIEKISQPQGRKPFVEIEEETPVKPVDTLAEEEAYERQQEELRRQEEEAPHSQGGGNSLEAEWPGEPSDSYWRSQLETAEEEFRQGRWAAAAARAGSDGLAGCGRARWLRARALDRAADHARDNRLLAGAVTAYLHLLKMNEALSDQRLLEVARRTVDRIQFTGAYLRAEPVYRLLIRRFPDDVIYRNNLTISFLMANRADLADEVLRETLRLWPNDRVALAHHGFVLKTHYNKLEEAVEALRKALDGDAGRANEPRFYYHLGDALLMLGRFDEAHEVHKRGAELGHFLSPSQRSLYNVPRLRGRPWWRIEDTPYIELARALEESWRDILKEGQAAVALYEQEKEGLRERGEWSQLDIFVRGREVDGRCARAPAVCAALRGAERGAGEGCRRGQVKFSMMTPGTHVRPHVGPTNCRLRMHLALSNTEGTYIRVDKEIRQWQLGKTFIFDDSFEHEVWHNGTGTRLVLIVDVWHPELTAAERRQLPAI